MSAAGNGSGRSRALAGLLAVALLVAALLWQDRGSLERANRLYRGGDASGAAALYRARSDTAGRTAAASYNLGTALLGLDADEAERHLRLAVRGADSAAAQRAHYNLGYRFLTRIDRSAEPDSAVRLLKAAIESNRAALRLDPDDEDARWNLALAQRLLDSLTRASRPADRKEEPGEDEALTDDEALTRSESADGVSGPEPDDPRQADNRGERQGAARGAREAWAGQDPGPLTEEQALRLVDGVTDSAEQLVRGILWSHRPDVAWWESQAYPGGDW